MKEIILTLILTAATFAFAEPAKIEKNDRDIYGILTAPADIFHFTQATDGELQKVYTKYAMALGALGKVVEIKFILTSSPTEEPARCYVSADMRTEIQGGVRADYILEGKRCPEFFDSIKL